MIASLGQVELMSNRPREAAARFADAFVACQAIADVFSTVESLLGFALSLSALRAPRDAATVHGALDAWAARIKHNLSPLNAQYRELAQASLREDLGDAFSDAYRYGAELAPDEVGTLVRSVEAALDSR